MAAAFLAAAAAAFVRPASTEAVTIGRPDRGSEPDAELIAACRSYIEQDTEAAGLCSRQEALADSDTPEAHAEWHRLDDVACGINVKLGDLEDLIEATPARTPEGIRAKAEVLLLSARNVRPEHGGPLARSLARDLLERA